MSLTVDEALAEPGNSAIDDERETTENNEAGAHEEEDTLSLPLRKGTLMNR
jgi:hypothetical protein